MSKTNPTTCDPSRRCSATSRRGPGRARAVGCCLVAVAGALLCVAPAWTAEPDPASIGTAPAPAALQAADVGRAPFAIDPDHPEDSVPSVAQREADPLRTAMFMMEISVRADDAMRARDYPTAIRYYRAFAKGEPEHAVAFSRLCQAHEALGQWAEAWEACATAVSKEGTTVADYLRALRVSVANPAAPPTPVMVQDIDAMLEHLKEENVSEEAYAFFPCELGMRLKDDVRLRACVQHLSEKFPEDKRTTTYAWSLAVQSGDFAGARHIIEDWQTSGDLEVPAKQFDDMLLATEAAERKSRAESLRAWASRSGIAGGVIAVSALVVSALRRRRAKRLIATAA